MVTRAHGPELHPPPGTSRSPEPVILLESTRIRADRWGETVILAHMETTAIRRRDYVRAVVTAARHRGESVAPWRDLGDVEEHFSDEGELLCELHKEWVRLLVGHLHYGGMVSQRTPGQIREVYHQACRDHPTLRSILDAHAADPALWEPTAREHAMIARVAGLVNADVAVEEAAAVGRALVVRQLPVQRVAVSA
jgi:hypothetical protein